ncbi:MAG: NUDIX domain-containing protein [Candidatus Aenigmarchaeota archaeon]|nr:NUDIX domain-containing protein [Candidatus Aenigmarchaeota archaeon]
MYDPKKAHYISATAIVVRDGKFLIAKRSPSEKAFPGKWTVPGGKLETSDYLNRSRDTSEHWYNIFEKLVEREVLEEVGLKIKNLNYLTSMAYIRPDGIPTIIVSFFADYCTGEVRLCSDLTKHAWVTLEEAKDYDLIEGIYEELEMLDKILKGEGPGKWQKKALL